MYLLQYKNILYNELVLISSIYIHHQPCTLIKMLGGAGWSSDEAQGVVPFDVFFTNVRFDRRKV